MTSVQSELPTFFQLKNLFWILMLYAVPEAIVKSHSPIGFRLLDLSSTKLSIIWACHMMVTLKPFLNMCRTTPWWESEIVHLTSLCHDANIKTVLKHMPYKSTVGACCKEWSEREKQTKTLSKYVHSFIGVRRIPMTDYCWTRVIEGLKPNPLKVSQLKSWCEDLHADDLRLRRMTYNNHYTVSFVIIYVIRTAPSRRLIFVSAIANTRNNMKTATNRIDYGSGVQQIDDGILNLS